MYINAYWDFILNSLFSGILWSYTIYTLEKLAQNAFHTTLWTQESKSFEFIADKNLTQGFLFFQETHLKIASLAAWIGTHRAP